MDEVPLGELGYADWAMRLIEADTCPCAGCGGHLADRTCTACGCLYWIAEPHRWDDQRRPVWVPCYEDGRCAAADRHRAEERAELERQAEIRRQQERR